MSLLHTEGQRGDRYPGRGPGGCRAGVRPILCPCSSSHRDENVGLFLSRTGHNLRASLAPRPRRWDSWVQFDIFDTDKLAGDTKRPNSKILSMESLVLT